MSRLEAIADLAATLLEGAKLLRPTPERLRRRARRKIRRASRLLRSIGPVPSPTARAYERDRKRHERASGLQREAAQLDRDADKLAAGT